MANHKIVLIGGGNMGRSLLRGILKAGLTSAENFTVVDVDEDTLGVLRDEYGMRTSTNAAEAVVGAEVVILAVKPYILNSVLDGLAPTVETDQLFISIVAGVKGSYISKKLGKNNPVVRCMPNIAAIVDAAASGVSACGSATPEHLDIAEELLGAVGEVVRVKENLLDAVTGLSGSGPAYIYMVIEALCDGGVRMGLTRDISMKLAIQTVSGAAQVVRESGEHPAVLKDRVTTPGGTTIAALNVLEAGGLRGMMIDAVVAATERAKAVAEETSAEASEDA